MSPSGAANVGWRRECLIRPTGRFVGVLPQSLEYNIDEFIKVAGSRQLDDDVFTSAGFARDAIVARIFGAGMATDAFCGIQTS